MFEKYPVFDPPKKEEIDSSINTGKFVVVSWKDKHNVPIQSELYPKELYEGAGCVGHGMFNLLGRTVEVRYRFRVGEADESYIMFI